MNRCWRDSSQGAISHFSTKLWPSTYGLSTHTPCMSHFSLSGNIKALLSFQDSFAWLLHNSLYIFLIWHFQFGYILAFLLKHIQNCTASDSFLSNPELLPNSSTETFFNTVVIADFIWQVHVCLRKHQHWSKTMLSVSSQAVYLVFGKTYRKSRPGWELLLPVCATETAHFGVTQQKSLGVVSWVACYGVGIALS